MEKIYTIGVYGTTEIEFFRALQKAKINLFCDIRQRRGVRGKTYRYANSQYLQEKLAELGIHYQHLKALAPTTIIRESQYLVDKEQGISKRQRNTLSQGFIQNYKTEILEAFDCHLFAQSVKSYHRVCFFCVECLPDACHRSLVAAKLSEELKLDLEHLIPCQKRDY